MVTLQIYVDGYFNRNVTMAAIPDKGDRLVFKDDPYKGYIVTSREIREDLIIIKTRLDK